MRKQRKTLEKGKKTVEKMEKRKRKKGKTKKKKHDKKQTVGIKEGFWAHSQSFFWFFWV